VSRSGGCSTSWSRPVEVELEVASAAHALRHRVWLRPGHAVLVSVVVGEEEQRGPRLVHDAPALGQVVGARLDLGR